MHPDRFSFLAGKHRQRRAVTGRDVLANGGTLLTLECGHTATIVPHFGVSRTDHYACHGCGEHYVRMAPQYAKEFECPTAEEEVGQTRLSTLE